jgi:hypothetical protein
LFEVMPYEDGEINLRSGDISIMDVGVAFGVGKGVHVVSEGLHTGRGALGLAGVGGSLTLTLALAAHSSCEEQHHGEGSGCLEHGVLRVFGFMLTTHHASWRASVTGEWFSIRLVSVRGRLCARAVVHPQPLPGAGLASSGALGSAAIVVAPPGIYVALKPFSERFDERIDLGLAH